MVIVGCYVSDFDIFIALGGGGGGGGVVSSHVPTASALLIKFKWREREN